MKESPRLKVVTTLRYRDRHAAFFDAIFEQADVVKIAQGDRAGLDRELGDADIALLEGLPDRRFLQAPKLRWIHCNQSGLDAFAYPAVFDSGKIVTSASGKSAETLAEHALFFLMAVAYRFADFHKAQRRGVWGLHGQNTLRGLYGRRVLIVGMGHTARALVPRCQALGMPVTVYRRRNLPSPFPDIPVFSQQAGDRLEDILPEIDAIALAASLNDTSHHLFDAAQFASMKQGTLIANVARAALLAPGPFRAALKSGVIGGAGLDVADQEPLPPWDPLWRMRNVLITPHVTPQIPDRPMAELRIIEENFSRFREGRELINVLGPDDMYTRGESIQPSAAARALAGAWRKVFRPPLN